MRKLKSFPNSVQFEISQCMTQSLWSVYFSKASLKLYVLYIDIKLYFILHHKTFLCVSVWKKLKIWFSSQISEKNYENSAEKLYFCEKKRQKHVHISNSL